MLASRNWQVLDPAFAGDGFQDFAHLCRGYASTLGRLWTHTLGFLFAGDDIAYPASGRCKNEGIDVWLGEKHSEVSGRRFALGPGSQDRVE